MKRSRGLQTRDSKTVCKQKKKTEKTDFLRRLLLFPFLHSLLFANKFPMKGLLGRAEENCGYFLRSAEGVAKREHKGGFGLRSMFLLDWLWMGIVKITGRREEQRPADSMKWTWTGFRSNNKHTHNFPANNVRSGLMGGRWKGATSLMVCFQSTQQSTSSPFKWFQGEKNCAGAKEKIQSDLLVIIGSTVSCSGLSIQRDFRDL